MSEPGDKLDIGALRDRFLECPVCIEHFNLTDRRPRLLVSCLHAFCTHCLDQLLEKEGKGQVTCPVCRHVEKVRGNAESLHIDPVREQLVEYLQITHKKDIVCDDCPDKNQATSRCVECGYNLCNDCALAHKRNKLTRSHQTATLGELVSETTRKLKIRHYCSAHPERAIECYCENCEKLCCLMCAVTSHKGHDINDLIDTSKIKMTKIESHLDEMGELSEKLIVAKQQCETYAKKLAKERDYSRTNIMEEFDKLENLLKKHKMAMLLKVEEETEKLASVARKQGSQYEDSLAEIESVKTYFDNAKTRTDEVSFLQAFPSMMKTFQNIASCNDRKMEISSKRVEFKATGTNDVQDSINAFGSVMVLDNGKGKEHPQDLHPGYRIYQAFLTPQHVQTERQEHLADDNSQGERIRHQEQFQGHAYAKQHVRGPYYQFPYPPYVYQDARFQPQQHHQEPQQQEGHDDVSESNMQDDIKEGNSKEKTKTIRVEGIKGLSSDMLCLYFENTRRSHGAGVDSIKVDEENETALITFLSEEVAEKVVGKRDHLINKIPVKVSLHTPTNVTNTIHVTGLPHLDETEFIEMYFENKRRSGGGPIARLKKSQTGIEITFEEDGVAERVVSKQHKLQGRPLSVELLQACDSSTLIVTGFSSGINKELLEMYFESQRRSGGGEIKKFEEKHGKIYITYEDPEVADRVLKRAHVLNGKTLTVVREGQHPVNEHVEGCVVEETVSKDTVEIKGYDTSAPDYSIELYFANKRKSGGGNIVKMDRDDKKGVIFITFESEEIANKVAAKQHILAGRVLQVRLCLPLQTYKDKILLSGVPKLDSEEFFVNYLESKIKLEVHRLLYGEEDGNVMVEFSEIIKDFDKVKETLKYKKFKQDGVEFDLEVSQIPQTSSITVQELPHQVTEDTIRLYFENTRKSGGDEVEEVTLHMEENFAVVSFKDPAVADRVTKREHKLLGTDICVSLHFECLGKKGGLLEPPQVKIETVKEEFVQGQLSSGKLELLRGADVMEYLQKML